MFNEAQKHSRGEALAEAFFFRMDRELIESLSRKLDREEKIGSFQVVTGIQDREIVESLVEARKNNIGLSVYFLAYEAAYKSRGLPNPINMYSIENAQLTIEPSK